MFALSVRFSHALFLGFLLASAALANSGGVGRSPKLLDSVERRTASDTTCNGNCWAGASWELDNGTFSYVTGTFNVPKVSGPNDSAATIWVGIDGDTCSTGVLVGVVCTVTDEGPTFLAQWLWLYEWNAVNWDNFLEVPIGAGDLIEITINLSNTTAGFGTVNNLSKNLSSIMPLASDHELCQQNAEWFLQSGSHTLADFSPVTFTNARAEGQGDTTYGLSGATTLEKEVDGQVVTSVAVESTSMTIIHL